jgi:hypothetical protein
MRVSTDLSNQRQIGKLFLLPTGRAEEKITLTLLVNARFLALKLPLKKTVLVSCFLFEFLRESHDWEGEDILGLCF